jgi:hypothetical protein
MVNVIAVPTQLTPALLYVGVTVMVAITGAVVALVATNDPILPEPLAANPIEGVLFTQLKTTLLPPLPLLGLTKAIAVVDEPLHKTWLAIAFTVAVGFTVILKVVGRPVQLTPLLVNVGVTVIVATTGVVVTLVATKVGILPVPLAAMPMDGALFVQL